MQMADLFGMLIPVTYLLMLVIERRASKRTFPKIRFWNLIGFFFLILIGVFATVLPSMLPQQWLAQHNLIDGRKWGILGGIAMGWVVLSFFNYIWHRNVHRISFLWRAFHQLHHSPTRVDIPGSVLFHPLEIIAMNVISVFVSVMILGLHPDAAAGVGYVAAFYGMFQHWNISTPRWMGYFIQRPEAHCIHHEKGVHAYNYADFPLWDLIFGTFKNPGDFSGEVGFDEEKSMRYSDMLKFRDVNGGENLLLR